MRSSDRSDALDLARGLPTTAADTDALRRMRVPRPLALDDYLRFLAELPPCRPESLRSRRGPRAPLPFRLD